MIYTKLDMRDMLVNEVYLDEDTLDILLKVLGDSSQSYIKILTALTDYKSFDELERNVINRMEGCPEDEDY